MTSAKIAAVGDILMWETQIKSAKQAEDVYSFDNMFEEVAPLLKEADLTIGNLETTFSGREERYQLTKPKFGYPMFNCPDELAETLKKSGFDVLTTANNHCLDRRKDGLKRTLDILDKGGFHHTGTFRSYEDSIGNLVIDVNGIKVGILSFTYGTNFNPIPREERWAVNLITTEMYSNIYKMKKLADLTIICLHFGYEFSRKSSETQRRLALKCFKHGADIVLGSHPHVIQPMERRRVTDIDGVEKDRFVIYSLGNFISDLMAYNIYTITGMILNLNVTKASNGETSITDIEYVPTWVYRNRVVNSSVFKILPISSYINRNNSGISPRVLATMKTAWTNTSALIGEDFKIR
jgi:poly-gamma-glutamate capsule biosynthesis protein CapA/YwtB (metallophosphatase superfamily)